MHVMWLTGDQTQEKREKEKRIQVMLEDGISFHLERTNLWELFDPVTHPVVTHETHNHRKHR